MRVIVGVLLLVGCGGEEIEEEDFLDRYRAGVCTWGEACAAATFSGYYDDSADCEENLITSATSDCTYDPEQAEACISLLESGDCETEDWAPDGETCSSVWVCATAT